MQRRSTEWSNDLRLWRAREPLTVDLPGDSPGPTLTFDLDEEDACDIGSMELESEAEANATTIALDEAGLAEMAQAEMEADAEAEAAAMAVMIQLEEADSGEGDDDDRALWEAPDDISSEDLREAQQDEQHTRLMGQYMKSRGLTQ